MAFRLNSILNIGAYQFNGVHEVKIVKSIYSFTDTCVIKVPTVFRLRQAGIAETESAAMATNTIFNEGDKVTVQLGYNGAYNNEFTGFVRRINFNAPVEIECEGYVYQLRNPLPAANFVSSNVKAILQYLIKGTDITLSPDIPNIEVDKVIINNITGAEVLEQLKKKLFGALTVFFIGNVLYAGLQYTNYQGNVTLRLGWNVIKDNQLKQRLADKVHLQINLTGVKNDGTKLTVTAGNSSYVQKHKTHIVTNAATLQAIANKMLQNEKYDGYEGKITCFGTPYYQHGWTVDLQDTRYPERAGKYFIESIEVLYGMNGFRRIGGIGIKVS